MLFDVLIPNMMFFYGSNNYKTTNTYSITLGGNVGNRECWVGDLTPLSHSSFHPNTLNWLSFVQFCQLITPQVITYCQVTLEFWPTSPPPLSASPVHFVYKLQTQAIWIATNAAKALRIWHIDLKNKYCCLAPLSRTGYPEGDVFLFPAAALRFKRNTWGKKQ